jgi:hypothetical protein
MRSRKWRNYKVGSKTIIHINYTKEYAKLRRNFNQ